MRRNSLDVVMAVVSVLGCATLGACSNGSGGHATGSAGAPGTAGASASAGTNGGTAGVGATTGSAGAGDTAGSSGGSNGTAGEGTTGSAGAIGSAGAAGGTSGGSAGSTGAAGAAGASVDGGAVDKKAAELAAGPFTCTEYLGAYLTMEWWNAGFLQDAMTDGIDTGKWQMKWHHHAGIPQWADPNNVFWSNTGDPLNDAQGDPIQSPCKQSSANPDRVVMLAISWELLTQADWAAGLEQDIATIKMKYSNVKWIDIMPMVRCPDDKMCNPNANYGPGADTNVGQQDCYVPPYEDAAIAQVVAAHPDVAEGPNLMATACVTPPNGAHLSAAGDKLEAQQIADYYKTLP